MELINSYIVPKNALPVRITEYILHLGEEFLQEIPTRNYVKKLIKKGNIKIDGEVVSTASIVRPGQEIELYKTDQKPLKTYKLKISVIYEDDYLAVLNKPAGIIVSGNRFRTVENALLHNIKVSSQPDALHLPRPVHRLDALTSGLLLIAKTRKVRQNLGEILAARQIIKTYQAIVIGRIQINGRITAPVNGQAAITEYNLLKNVHSLKCDWLSLLELRPLTGRTHQLRIHLAGLGFPILGDNLYGSEKLLFKGKGLFLSATGLEFYHPVTGEELQLKIEAPTKFAIHLEREERRWKKYN
jgi:RluA family pseudouridine synthase